jgi:hypothetical protein
MANLLENYTWTFYLRNGEQSKKSQEITGVFIDMLNTKGKPKTKKKKYPYFSRIRNFQWFIFTTELLVENYYLCLYVLKSFWYFLVNSITLSVYNFDCRR